MHFDLHNGPLPEHARRIIGIDVDDTLLELTGTWLDAYFLASGHRLSVEDVLDWNISRYVLPDWAGDQSLTYGNGRFHELRTPELYRTVRPIPGAQWGVRTLHEQGHRLVAITSDTRAHAREKRRALARWFPELDEMVITQRKDCVRVDVLIDDAVHNVQAVSCGALLFPRPANLLFPDSELRAGVARVTGWADILWRFCC